MTNRRPHRRQAPGDPCTVNDCTKVAEAHGLCHGHFQRWQRHGDVQADRPLGRQGALCSVDGCERPSDSRDMCKAHYNRTQRHGDPHAEKPIRVTSGLGSVSHGYRSVPVPRNERKFSNGMTTELEHRLVMARQLGRPLAPDESVHHRNGDRLDNRPANLELWSRWQPSGQDLVDKLAWAVELLLEYWPGVIDADELSGRSPAR